VNWRESICQREWIAFFGWFFFWQGNGKIKKFRRILNGYMGYENPQSSCRVDWKYLGGSKLDRVSRLAENTGPLVVAYRGILRSID